MPKAARVYAPELAASISRRPHRRSSNDEPSSPANEERWVGGGGRWGCGGGAADNKPQARHGGDAELHRRSRALAFNTLNSAAEGGEAGVGGARWWAWGRARDPFTQVINTHFHGCIHLKLRWHRAECEYASLMHSSSSSINFHLDLRCCNNGPQQPLFTARLRK